MFSFLFPRLTARPRPGTRAFDAVTARARQAHWYVEGQVPDTIDGRFRVVATLTALAILRLESAGGEGQHGSVALTERFIEVMESEHREIGLGDPALGRKVQKLVGSLAGRVELWRSTIAGGDWDAAVNRSMYKDEAAQPALRHSADALSEFWAALTQADAAAIMEGRLG